MHLSETITERYACTKFLKGNAEYPLQSGAPVPDREAAVRVLQGGVQGAEEKPREILFAVCEREPFDVRACREAKGVLLRIGTSLPFSGDCSRKRGISGRIGEIIPLQGSFFDEIYPQIFVDT